MNNILKSLIILALSLTSLSAYAIGRCPDTADKIEDFARCLAPVRGAVAMRYVGAPSDLDNDHVKLVNTLQNMKMPQQVIPSYVTYPSWPVSIAGAYLQTGYGYNPYLNWNMNYYMPFR